MKQTATNWSIIEPHRAFHHYAIARPKSALDRNGGALLIRDLDITALVAFHRASGAEGTIALTPVEDPSAFGVVPTALSEIRLTPERLKDARLVLVPTPEVLEESAAAK